MISSYLFDSHALLAFFQKEKWADVVAGVLRRAIQEGGDRLLCLINLGEILYTTKRRFGDAKKMEVLSRIHQLGIKILSIPDSLVYEAAELKAQYPISYADAFAVSPAQELKATIVTGDPELKQDESLVTLHWL